MSAAPLSIELEDDPVPIVRIIGTQFKRAAQRDGFAAKVRRVQGSFALASNKDPQALTVTIRKNAIRIARGIDPAARITIRLDFDRMGEPGYSPTIIGLYRHPLFTYRVARLLDFPKESWTDAAKRFWDHNRQRPRMPKSMKIVCNDDQREISLGDGEPEVEMHGSAAHLTDLFTGSAILVQIVMNRQIKIVSSLEHAAVLSEATQQLMLGEDDREH